MDITSTDITPGERIDAQFTCEGEDLSPQLSWSEVPDGTQELVLLCEDPDAPGGTFIHWVAANIDPSGSGFQRGTVPDGVTEGGNDYGGSGYGGPCPPKGHGKHRYYFRLFALASKSGLRAGATAAEARAAMGDRVLAEAELMGTYERS